MRGTETGARGTRTRSDSAVGSESSKLMDVKEVGGAVGEGGGGGGRRKREGRRSAEELAKEGGGGAGGGRGGGGGSITGAEEGEGSTDMKTAASGRRKLKVQLPLSLEYGAWT
eukprot:3940274-Rhodomonas_salina.2